MKLRIILLVIAIVLGVVAVVAVVGYISNIKSSVEEEVEKVEVLIAAQNIPKEASVETILDAKAVKLEAIPRKYLANGVLTSLEDYSGFVAAAPINEGEQITSTKFVKPEQIGLAFMIPKDMVAVSIPIDEVIGVSNLINVGDMVNVIATFKPKEEKEEEAAAGEAITGEETAGTGEVLEVVIQKEITKTLLWNVEVLYVGTRIITIEEVEESDATIAGQVTKETKSKEVTTITLAVTPEQSEKLVFTEEMGSVWLALTPTDGIERVDTEGQTLDNIFD